MLTFLHNSQKIEYREPFGAVPVGTEVTLKIECFDDNLSSPTEIKEAYLVLSDGNEKELVKESSERVNTMYGERFVTTFSISLLPSVSGVIFYYFKFNLIELGKYIVACYGNNENLYGGVGKCYENKCDYPYQITVYEKNLKVPKWFQKGFIYQIFPDRFCKGYDAITVDKPNSFYYGSWDDTPFYVKDNNGDIVRWDFHRGNLSGISSKISYIEDLGADIIYLNPIFKARSNHRYDTCDYKEVDGLLGGDTAFDLLSFLLQKENIKLMLDGVFSHTGADSIFFDKYGKYGHGAFKNSNSPYRDWYTFKTADDEDYECWWGVKDLPNVNEMTPTYVDYICRDEDSVIKKWIRRGASGWRLDVADELPDEFIKEIRKASDEAGRDCDKETVILGEVWEDASNKTSYDKLRTYFTSKELHTVTNYPFRENLLSFFKGEKSGLDISKAFMSLKENYPSHNYYSLVNMTGTHDVKRLMIEMLSITNNHVSDAKSLVKAYASCMFTFPGVPLVYYGDETCLEGGKDPDNRRTYPWGKEDKNMIKFFSLLAKLRKDTDAFVSGEIEFLNISQNFDEDVFVYSRIKDNKNYICVFSREYEKNIKISGLMPGDEYYYLVSGRSKDDESAIVDINGELHLFVEGNILICGNGN